MYAKRLWIMDRLRNFVGEEIRKRDMSIRQFSDLVGVSHPTILRILDEHADFEPSISVLSKIARATHVDLCTLVSMVAPEATLHDVEIEILAARIARLPETQRQMIDMFLVGAINKPDKKAL